MPVTRYTEAVEIVDIEGGETSPCLYLGDKDTDGTWRCRMDGTSLKQERRESGSYAEKQSLDSSGNPVFAGAVTVEAAILYLGPSGTDGTWRIRVDGDSLKMERRESGSYVEKQIILEGE